MQTLNPGYETKDEDNDNTYEGNSLYWNSQDGRCYYSSGNGETTCNLSGYGYYVWYKYSGGYLSYTYPYTNYAIRPVVYLKATTKLVGGRGKSTDPYQIEI